MEWFLGNFNRTGKDSEVKYFPTDKATKLAQMGEEFAESLQNNLILVDFEKTPKYTDPNEALMCVSVLTSDGRKGSISHLQTNVKIIDWATSLLEYHQRPCSACLAGGEDGISDTLISNITSHLEDIGFQITGKDVGGQKIYRTSTLFSDHIEVKKRDYAGYHNSIQLEFTKN